MPLPVVPVLVGISLVFWILVARAAATAGVATVCSPIVPAYFIISALGAPLQPLGFAIGVGWLTGHIWLSAMVSWGLKLAILHYWGASMFQRLKPFFLG